MKSTPFFVAALALSSVGFENAAAQAQSSSGPRTGAVIQQVQNGQPVGPAIPLPDCRSCKVTQTGPNSYTIKVPERVKQQVQQGASQPKN